VHHISSRRNTPFGVGWYHDFTNANAEGDFDEKMLNRQKILLHMLQASNGSVSHFELTKWLFLLGEESPSRGGSSFYQFVPYKYGPYSFSLYHEVGNLTRDGLVQAKNNRTWSLTDAGKNQVASLSPQLEREIKSILRKYGGMGFTALLEHVYHRYPWFTMLSKAVSRWEISQPIAAPAVYTAGYEGLMVEEFVSRVLRFGIRRLIDVRNNPTSRRYGFHRSTLERICNTLEFEYEHLPHLGIPALQRSKLSGPIDFETIFANYERDILLNRSLLIPVVESLNRTPGVLVCLEADPDQCHRSRLARIVSSIAGLPVIHIGE